MFERILIRRSTDSKQATDLGALAEALLFYRHADWLLDQGSLFHAVQLIGVDNLIALFSSQHVTPTFVHNAPIIESRSRGMFRVHRFGLVEVEALGSDQPKLSDEARIADILMRASGGSATGAQKDQLLDQMTHSRVGVDRRPERNIELMMKAEIGRPGYLSQLARITVETLIPGFYVPADWHFDMKELEQDRYVIATNYDFEQLNQLYHKTVPVERGSIDRAYLAACLVDARVDLDLATQYGIELMTDPKASAVIQFKISEAMTRRAKSAHQIAAFQELTLNNSRAVREAINSGERNFSDFMALLEKAEGFKAWLGKANPDVGNLTHYYAQVCADSWAEKLPAKILRYSVFTGAGLLADLVAAGASELLGAADTFLLDSILRGWRPNQFVDASLVPFTKSN